MYEEKRVELQPKQELRHGRAGDLVPAKGASFERSQNGPFVARNQAGRAIGGVQEVVVLRRNGPVQAVPRAVRDAKVLE